MTALAALPDHERPEPGPLAVIPDRSAFDAERAIRAAGGEVSELGPNTRGVIYTSFTDVQPLIEALDEHPEIGWVHLPFAGIDAYAEALAPYADRGVVFTSGKGINAQPVAEHGLMLILSVQRLIGERTRATEWGTHGGRSLFGNRVVIVGAGGVAHQLIRMLEAFGCDITVVRRQATPVAGAARTVTVDDLDEAIAEADVVVLAAAATGKTRHLIDRARLASMKPTAVLVNIARGSLVDTEALVEALDEGRIFGAGLDVTEPEPLPAGHPLFQHRRCVLTPHTADTPEMTHPLVTQRIEHNTRAFLETGEFVGLADPRLGY